MMNDEKYKGWFGIPINDIDFDSDLKKETNFSLTKKDELTILNKNQKDIKDDIKDNSIKEQKNNYKNLLVKKRKLNKEENISEVKKLIKKGVIKENFKNEFNKNKDYNKTINAISDESNNNDNFCNYENSSSQKNINQNNNINQLNKSKDSKDSKTFKKIFTYDDRSKDGIVKFNGIKNKFGLSEYKLKHCIYLRTQNDFNYEKDGKIYTWKIKILSSSKFLGVGLADKYIVMQNKFKFFSKEKDFYNGVFCIYSLYKQEKKEFKIYPWHPGNIKLNDNEINFPYFTKGLEIIISYDSLKKTLEFLTGNIVKKAYKMENVTPQGGFGRNTFTPCIIFFYPGDEIQISKFLSKNIIE